jgi:hypothetical protein
MSDMEKWKNKTRDYTKTEKHGAVRSAPQKRNPAWGGAP